MGAVEDVEGSTGNGDEEKNAEEYEDGPEATEAEAAAAAAPAVVMAGVEGRVGAVRVAHGIVDVRFGRWELWWIVGGRGVGGGGRGGGAIGLA